MQKTEIAVRSTDGTVLPGLLWEPENSPRGVVQITHGMTEHIGRYDHMAEVLTAHGIAAAGFDLRGHGKRPGEGGCASFGQEGWEASLEEMHRFHDWLAESFPQIPQALFGFSLGSFLVRDYLSRYREAWAGALILGTGSQPGPVLSVLKMIVRREIRKAGFDRTTPLVQKLSFGAYNQKFAPNRTPADWLCADREELNGYLADPLCRESISAGLFWQLLDAMQRTEGVRAFGAWPKKLPVLLLSGDRDPVGDFGKGVRNTQLQMKKAGLEKTECLLLSGARHDVLHEVSGGQRAEAERAILAFLEKTF